MPMRCVGIVEIAECGDVPADAVALPHGHQRHVSEDVAVDGPLDIGVDKTSADDGTGHPLWSNKRRFFAVHAAWVGSMSADIVLEVPALVLVEGDVHTDELSIHVLWATIGKRHAAASHHDDAEQSGRDVLQFLGVG